MITAAGKRRHRSKTGCATCRQRRVKCDETHPQCIRCTKARLSCSYTPVAQVINAAKMKNVRKAERILLPNRDETANLTFIRPTAILPGENEVENRYLKYFEQETTSDFPSIWDWSVWNRLVLQGCHHEAFIRDAVVAIGALNKSLRSSAPLEPGGNGLDELARLQRQFAYQTYGRALRKIQDAIDSGSNPRDTLIACLLVICFESHNGDRYGAVMHAHHGLRIYHQLMLRDKPPKLEEDIVDAFRNLDIAVAATNDDRSIEMHEEMLIEDASTAASVPSTFADLDEAKRYWHIIMRRCCHFIPTTWATTNPSPLSQPIKTFVSEGATTTTVGKNIHTASSQITPELEAEQSVYYAELCRWITAFEPLLTRVRRIGQTKLRHYVTATLLQIQALNAKITLAGILYVDEMGYDAHLPDFTSMIELSNDLVRINKCGTPTTSFSGLFALDLGLVVPLFTLLLKCRNRELRRQGIRILEQWHVEGWWDPPLIIAVCKCLIDAEEEEMVDGEIPKESRAILTAKCHSPPDRHFVVQFVQRRKEGLRWTERIVEM